MTADQSGKWLLVNYRTASPCQDAIPELPLTHQVSFEYLAHVAVVSLHYLLHTLPVAEDKMEVLPSAEDDCP